MSDSSGELLAAHRNLLLLQQDNIVLAEALRKCRDQFAFYTREHSAAGKTEKAATNESFVKVVDKAFATTKHNGFVPMYDKLRSGLIQERDRLKEMRDNPSTSADNRHDAILSMGVLNRVLDAV